MTIIAYRNYEDLDVQFEDGTIIFNKTYNGFKKGSIKNPYYRSVYGVGFLGDASIINSDGNVKQSYTLWANIIGRCYYSKRHETHPWYADCEVCKEWHCYEVFQEWFDQNYYTLPNGEQVHLDKDILMKGNKVYSPQTARFVPVSINDLIGGSNKKSSNGLPMGVVWNKKTKKYQAQISIDGKLKNLGYFDNIKDSYETYKQAKKKEIVRKANQYKDVLPSDVYEALINWQFDDYEPTDKVA